MIERRRRLVGVVGAAIVVGAVWTAVAWWIAPRVTPTVPDVVRQMWHDRAFYAPHLRTTLSEAAWGYLWGNLAGGTVAALIVLVAPLSALFERLSVAVYCLPLLAIGPILQIVTTGSSTKLVLAARPGFLTTMFCCVLGWRCARRPTLGVV